MMHVKLKANIRQIYCRLLLVSSINMVNVVSSPSAVRKTVSEHSETQYQRECVSKLRQSVTDLQVSVSKEAQPTFASVPPYHPAFRPHCLSPITQVCHRFAIYLGLVPHPLTRFVQILERQGWKWLEPEYANKTLKSGKQHRYTPTQGWHTRDATLVIQYWNPSKHTEQLFVETASNRYVMGIASKNVIGGSKLDQYGPAILFGIFTTVHNLMKNRAH